MQTAQEFQAQLNTVSSQSKEWEVHYFATQSYGLAELACEKDSTPINERMREWRKEVIMKARLMRQELLKRFGYVMFGHLVLDKKGELVH